MKFLLFLILRFRDGFTKFAKIKPHKQFPIYGILEAVTKKYCQFKREEVEGKILLVQATGDVIRCDGEGILSLFRGLNVIKIFKLIKVFYTSVDLQTQYC